MVYNKTGFLESVLQQDNCIVSALPSGGDLPVAAVLPAVLVSGS